MSTIYLTEYKSPYGELILGDLNGKVCLMDWKHRAKRSDVDTRITRLSAAKMTPSKTDLHIEAIRQLEEYFAEQRSSFNLPLQFFGSDFQKRVWEGLLKIGYGETLSYLNLSKKLGDEKAIRAVASANGANAISIIVPCHRIIGSNGELTGYAGGLNAKKRLLQLEGSLNSDQLYLFD